MPSRPATVSRRGFLQAAAGVSIGASAFPVLAQLRDNSPLKITKVEPYLVRIGERTSYPLARVETADGLYGWGEGTTPPSSPAVLTQIRECGKLILNESAWDVEKLWRHMYIVEENTLGGTLFAAISAIDIALWDIIGKKLNVPLYKLLGGKTRDKIRIYTSYRWGNIPRTRDAYAQRTKELIAQGATAGKYDPFGPYPGYDRQLSTSILNEVREMITGIREAGPNFDICVECHGKWNLASAGRIIRMLEPFDPFLSKSRFLRKIPMPWRCCSIRLICRLRPGKACKRNSTSTPFWKSRPRAFCSRTPPAPEELLPSRRSRPWQTRTTWSSPRIIRMDLYARRPRCMWRRRFPISSLWRKATPILRTTTIFSLEVGSRTWRSGASPSHRALALISRRSS